MDANAPNQSSPSENDPKSAAAGQEEGNTAVAEAPTTNAEESKPTVFQELSPKQTNSEAHNDIDFILDIPIQLTVELGRTKIAIKNLLQLTQDSVLELDGMAGDPLDVLVNGCLIAQGEVVVVNEKFGLRLTDIITPAERIRKLNK